jgi:hypothetical protein
VFHSLRRGGEGVGRYQLKLIYAQLKLSSLGNSAETIARAQNEFVVDDFAPGYQYLFRLGVKHLFQGRIGDTECKREVLISPWQASPYLYFFCHSSVLANFFAR